MPIHGCLHALEDLLESKTRRKVECGRLHTADRAPTETLPYYTPREGLTSHLKTAAWRRRPRIKQQYSLSDLTTPGPSPFEDLTTPEPLQACQYTVERKRANKNLFCSKAKAWKLHLTKANCEIFKKKRCT